jgi:hypothetical protein
MLVPSLLLLESFDQTQRRSGQHLPSYTNCPRLVETLELDDPLVVFLHLALTNLFNMVLSSCCRFKRLIGAFSGLLNMVFLACSCFRFEELRGLISKVKSRIF